MTTNARTKALIPRSRGGGERAHVKKIVQGTPPLRLALTEKQLLELAHIVTVALRDKSRYLYANETYRLLITSEAVGKCDLYPECDGKSGAAIDLKPNPQTSRRTGHV